MREEEEGKGRSSLMLGKPLNLQDHALIVQPLCRILDCLPLELFSLASSPVEEEEEEEEERRRRREGGGERGRVRRERRRRRPKRKKMKEREREERSIHTSCVVHTAHPDSHSSLG